MARRALLVGINDYRGLNNLRGCVNDVLNMRSILKDLLGFTNNDIRAVLDARATRAAILHRLEYMVDVAEPGDFMIFHFSGHGSQIRDREGDELEDGLDELICPHDMDWDGNFILDDDLYRIFRRIPEGAHLEVFLDCCHSETGTRSTGPRPSDGSESTVRNRYLPPPLDIWLRQEGEEAELGQPRGFRGVNRSGARTLNHVLWAAAMAHQEAADAPIDGEYHGAFTYYFCRHMRETGGAISRRNLLDRVRNSLNRFGFWQIPQLETPSDADRERNPLQIPVADAPRRMLRLTTPYMRGEDVREVQAALARAGYRIVADGVFGPHTHATVRKFQQDRGLIVDGIVGTQVYGALFG
jgi:metacaspase-1